MVGLPGDIKEKQCQSWSKIILKNRVSKAKGYMGENLTKLIVSPEDDTHNFK